MKDSLISHEYLRQGSPQPRPRPTLEEIGLKKQAQYLKLAQDLKNDLFEQDKLAGKYIQNQLLKAFFNILLKLSYAFFTIGIALTFQDGGLSEQSIIEYIKKGKNKIYLILLAFLGFVIFSILKQIKEQNKISPNIKKKLNFVVDILRTIFYISSLVFAGTYVFDNDNSFLQLAFYAFILSIILFIVRKTLKWRYYRGEGKNIIGPWESKNATDTNFIQKMIKLIDAYQNKEKAIDQEKKEQEKKDYNRESGKKIHLRIDEIQAELKKMDTEREKLLTELKNIVGILQ